MPDVLVEKRAPSSSSTARFDRDRAGVAGGREEAAAVMREPRLFAGSATPFVPVTMSAAGATIVMLPPGPADLRDAAHARAVQHLDRRRVEADVAAGPAAGRCSR